MNLKARRDEGELLKKAGVLHAELSKIIAQLGHGQTIVIADYGLPAPRGVRVVDLAVRPGLPPFLDVLQAILAELSVESIEVAKELEQQHPAMFRQILNMADVPCTTVEHEALKHQLSTATAIVRTGECTSYANVILTSGVLF